MANKRTYITLGPELEAKLKELSARMGVTKTQLISMCVTAGMGNVMRAFYPEEAITAEKYAQIIAEMIKTGQPITLPDGSIVGSEGK